MIESRLWTMRWAVVCAVSLVAACNGHRAAMPGDTLQRLDAHGAGWDRLAEGDTAAACDAFWASDASPATLYGRGECARLLGQYTRSAEAYAQLLTTAPASPWASFAATRLPEAWHASNGGRAPSRRACDALRTAPDAPIWGRYRASLCAMSDERVSWAESDSAAPFDGGPFGVPTMWRVVGPTSVRAALDFEAETEPEADPVMKDSYDLLGFRRTAALTTARGHLDLDAYGGIYVAETWLTLDREMRLDAVLEYPGLALVRIDGEEILRRDDRERSQPNTLLVRGIRLSAGTHRVTMRVAVDRGYKRYVQLALLPAGGAPLDANPWVADGDGPYVLAPRFAGGPSGAVLDAGAPSTFFDVRPDAMPTSAPVVDALTHFAIETHDEWLARAALARLASDQPMWAGLSMARHELLSTLWTVPSKIRRKDSLRALRAALAADPDQNLARLRLAEMLREQQLKDSTGAVVDEIIARGPDEAHNWREAARYYAWRGFTARAEAAWRRATELAPDDCGAASELYRALRSRDATPTQLTPVQARCDGTSWLFAQDVARLRGEERQYLERLRRDVHRYPDQAWRWVQWLRALRADAPDDVPAAAQSALAWHPADVDAVSLAADIYASRGDRDAARTVIERALADHSGSSALHRQLSLLDGDLPLRDLLADGPAAIQAYERSEEQQELNASAIYVLDYMARRYFEDGTSADVTHLVVKVLAKEGLDEHGEIGFPGGSVPLLLRTIKKNGRVIEPQAQEGKSKVSMVGLDVGDYVEYAYLTFSGRIPTQRGAVRGANFYFKMSNIASAHSEFIVDTPVSWDPRFLPEHDAPVAEITQVGGYVRHRYLRTGSVQQRDEPDSVANAEHLPHVQMLHRYRWEDVHRRIQDDVASTATLTPLLAEVADQVVADAGATRPRQIVRALFAYVIGQVKSPRAGDFATPAAFVALTGEGNPVILLRALLRAHGIQSAIYQVRPTSADPVDTELPEFDKYSVVALRVEVDGGIWLYPSGKYAPFDLLPTDAQGVPAINVEPGAPFARETTPTFDPQYGVIEDEIEAALAADGTLTGTLRIIRRGFSGAARRDEIEELGTADKHRKYLERDLNYVISGGEMTASRIVGQETPGEPLIIEIEFRRPGYARVGESGVLVIEDRYALPDLTRRHARLAERTVPMLLRRRDSVVRVRLTVPEGRSVDPVKLPDVLLEGPFGTYSRRMKLEDGVLALDMRLAMPTQRVATEVYREFAVWAGNVDRGTYLRIEVR